MFLLLTLYSKLLELFLKKENPGSTKVSLEQIYHIVVFQPFDILTQIQHSIYLLIFYYY